MLFVLSKADGSRVHTVNVFMVEQPFNSQYKDVLSALVFLHDRKIAHRDMKPENILIEKKVSLNNISYINKAKVRIGINSLKSNESQLKNPEISGAIFTLSLSKRILNSQCVEGARDVRVL